MNDTTTNTFAIRVSQARSGDEQKPIFMFITIILLIINNGLLIIMTTVTETTTTTIKSASLCSPYRLNKGWTVVINQGLLSLQGNKNNNKWRCKIKCVCVWCDKTAAVVEHYNRPRTQDLCVALHTVGKGKHCCWVECRLWTGILINRDILVECIVWFLFLWWIWYSCVYGRGSQTISYCRGSQEETNELQLLTLTTPVI